MNDNEFTEKLLKEREEKSSLQKKLNSALEELAKTNSELLQLTLELDDRVEERTMELRQSEERIERLNLALRAIRNVNKLITRERDRNRLLENICKLLIQTRAYYGSWIALLGDSEEISAIAEAGFGDKFFNMKDRLKSGDLPLCVKNALIQPEVLIIDNNHPNCSGCPFSSIRESNEEMFVRLEHDKKVYGILSVSLPVHSIDEEEKSLFQEVADDIAFALHRIELLEEREKAVDALRVSEENYRLLVENQSDIVIRTDTEGKFQFVSPSFCALFGKKEEELIGEHFLPLIHEEDRKRTMEEIADLDKPPYTCYLEHRAYTKDGIRWLFWSDNAVLDENNNIVAFSAIGRDITDRKLAEEELWRTKERFRNLVETSSDWVWELDREGIYTYVSPKVKDMVGYDPEEIIGKAPVDFMSPEEAEVMRGVYYKLVTLKEPLHYVEGTFFHKDGHEVVTEASGVPFFDSDGKFSGLRGITRNVTQRKQAEEALREQLNFMQRLIDTIPNPIYYKDFNGIFRGCNTAFQEYIGRSRDEIIGKNIRELASLYMLDGYNEIDLELLKKPGIRQYESYFRHADGNLRYVVFTKASFTRADGSVAGVVGVIIDITDRKQAEEERVRLMTAIEQADEGVIITDEKGIIKYVNPALEDITGYLREELIDRPAARSFMIDENKSLFKDVILNVGTGEVWKGQFKIKTKDSKERQLYATTSPIKDPSGNVINFVILTRDITHEAFMEKQLQQAQKMEAIGTLAGGIAHDFNNILSAVIGFTEISLPAVDESASIHRNLSEVLKAGLRAKELVKQILTFSRQGDYEAQPVQVSLIVKEVLKLLRASLPATIEIQRNIQSDSTVMGNPTQIHQVMMNLCTNAAHAMEDEPGVLSVSLTDEVLDEETASRHPDMKPGKYLKLTVEDTGCGMNGEVMERIFDPFFTTKKKGEGTGMGLSVVHGIVKSYGGAINVKSEVGKGSRFDVYFLPIESKAETATEIETAIPTGTERILLIDDEQPIVNMGRQMLEQLGYNVTSQINSIEALDLFENHYEEFDLVITDMTMPYMTGEELAKNFLAIRPDIPIVLCTGFNARLTKEKADSIGIKALALKPFSLRELAETVRQVLDERD